MRRSAVVRGQRPQDDRVAAERHADALPVSAPQHVAAGHAANRAGHHPPHDQPEREIEPDHGVRAAPDQVAHGAVVAIDHPRLAGHRGRHPTRGAPALGAATQSASHDSASSSMCGMPRRLASARLKVVFPDPLVPTTLIRCTTAEDTGRSAGAGRGVPARWRRLSAQGTMRADA